MAISFSLTSSEPTRAKVDVLAVPVYEGARLAPGAEAVDRALSGRLRAFLKGVGFEGQLGSALVLPSTDGVAAGAVVVVGAGPRDRVDAERVRKTAAAVAQRVPPATSVATTLLDLAGPGLDMAEVAQAAAEGFVLGTYKYVEHKGAGTKDRGPSKLRRVQLVGDGAAARRGLAHGALVARGVTLARDLVNGPAGSITPRALARAARGLKGVRTTVWDEARCRRERLGALLGVAAGSDEPPCLIRMTYAPPRSRATVALVGKGITFDSGGLSLKPSQGMETMKSDMAGGAAIVGAMSILSELQPPVRVVGIVPTTENMPSGHATRVGDVLTARNGKTIEVLNTDAEGRLVLADGLSLAAEDKPDAIVDIATLTGACPIALGDHIAGLLGNNHDLVHQIRAAAERSGERVWELPLPDDYRKLIDSDVADVKNISGGRSAGTIVGALFVREFVDGLPWAHLDIAGPAFRSEADGHLPKGATGYGVRLLTEFVLGFRKPRRR